MRVIRLCSFVLFLQGEVGGCGIAVSGRLGLCNKGSSGWRIVCRSALQSRVESLQFQGFGFGDCCTHVVCCL